MKKFGSRLESEELTNYTTSVSSVTGERVEGHSLSAQNLTRTNIISARPSISFVRPTLKTSWGDSVPIVYVGYENTIVVQGYNFDTDVTVYLSAGTGVYTTNALSGVSEFNLYTNVRGLSSQFPAFSGIQLNTNQYDAKSPNALIITIPAAQSTGYINIIIANNGGYGTFYDDYEGRIVNVKL